MKEANGFSQWFLSLCRVASGFKQYSQGKGVPTTAQVPSKICYRKVLACVYTKGLDECVGRLQRRL